MDSNSRSFALEKYSLKALVCACVLASACISSHAGLAEADAAYQNKNYDLAFKEFLPLAKQGNAHAQNYVGLMYANGLGVA